MPRRPLASSLPGLQRLIRVVLVALCVRQHPRGGAVRFDPVVTHALCRRSVDAVMGRIAPVASCVVLAGCGVFGTSGRSTPASARSGPVKAVRDARVVGVARPCGHTPVVCFGVRSVSVSVVDASNRVVATSSPAVVSGRFSFRVVPGPYTVVLNVNGGVLAQAGVVAGPQRTTRTDLTNPFIR